MSKTQQPGELHSPEKCKKKLEVSPTLSFPRDELTRVIAFFGQRGSGKTYSAGVVQEEELLACGRFIVFDPVRAHRGILYAENVTGVNDLKISDAEFWAQEVTKKGNRQSYVFDLAPLGFKGARKFINLFCEKALLLNSKPLKVYIEEAHLFLPLYTSSENENIVRLATVGRAYGWGLTLISQRPAQVNKDVLTQADAIIAMRLMYPLDVDAIQSIWAQAMPWKQTEDLAKKLPKQKAGQGIIFSSEWLENDFYTSKVKHQEIFLKQVQFRQKYTPHLAGTPKFEPEADLKEVEIQKQDLNKAEEHGLDVKDPEKVDYNSSKSEEAKSRLLSLLVVFLGVLGGFSAGDLLGNDQKNNLIKAGTGAGIALMANKNEFSAGEGIGFGLLGNSVMSFLRENGYLSPNLEEV